MVSGLQVLKFQEFSQKHGFVYSKHNIREWGSYDLAVQLPNHPQILNTGRTFGWGFTLEQAAAEWLTSICLEADESDYRVRITEILGRDIIAEITFLHNIHTFEQQAPILPVETPDEVEVCNICDMTEEWHNLDTCQHQFTDTRWEKITRKPPEE